MWTCLLVSFWVELDSKVRDIWCGDMMEQHIYVWYKSKNGSGSFHLPWSHTCWQVLVRSKSRSLQSSYALNFGKYVSAATWQDVSLRMQTWSTCKSRCSLWRRRLKNNFYLFHWFFFVVAFQSIMKSSGFISGGTRSNLSFTRTQSLFCYGSSMKHFVFSG